MSTIRTQHASVFTDFTPLPGAPARARALLRKLTELFVVWRLRALCELDDHLLKDVGLTRGALWCEAMPPYWLASGPVTWLPCGG